MAVFKKTIKYSKSSKNLEDKIKNLDEDLKKTGVLYQEGSIVYGDQYKTQIEINEQSNSQKEDELYDWRKSFIPEDNPSIFNNEVLGSNITEEYVEEIREKHRKLSLVESSIEAIKVREAQNIFQELYQDQVEQVVEKYVSYHSKDIISLREDLFLELKKKPTVDISSLEEKINLLTIKYKKLSEGLLNDPSQNSDPLTQSPVTLEQLKNHYQLLVGRLQEQLATLGGGGETRLKYLDDIVGIATNASAYDEKFLKYNHSLGKFEFVTVSNGGESYWSSTAAGINTLSNVGIGTTNPTSKLTVDGSALITGVVTATSFVGDGSGLTGIVGSGSGIVILDNGSTVGTAGTIDFGDNLTVSPISSGIVTVTASGGTSSSQWVTTSAGIHTLSNVGIGSTNPTSPLTVVGNASISGQTNTNSLSVTGTTITSQLTVSGNSTFNGNVNVGLVGSLNIGVDGFNPNGDLQIYKDFGTNNSIIKYDGSNNFYVLTDNLSIRNSSSTYNKADFSSTTVKLYAGGSGGGIKFETLGVGATITGTTFTNQLSVSGVSTLNSNVSVGGTISVDGGVKLATNNATIVGTSGTVGEIKRIGGAPFFYDGSAWREFVLSSGTPVSVPADTEWDNVVFRATFDTDFTDAKFGSTPVRVSSGSTTVGSPVKIGTGAFRNDGSITGAGVSYAYRSDYDFTGSWTIEFWIYHDSFPAQGYYTSLVSQVSTVNSTGNWAFGLAYNGSTISWLWDNENGTQTTINQASNSTFTNAYLDKWVHYALVREGDNGSIHFYVNGTETVYTYVDQLIDNDILHINGAGLVFGAGFGQSIPVINNNTYNTNSIDAIFDDVRISCGVGTAGQRYTSNNSYLTQNFTPPTTALPTTGTLSSYVQPPGDKYGEMTLGGSPTWRGTSGVTVSQQSSGNYRVSFASTYTNANDYYVLSQGMDQGFASYVSVARSTTHVDLAINRQSNDAAVDTGALAVQIKNHI